MLYESCQFGNSTDITMFSLSAKDLSTEAYGDVRFHLALIRATWAAVRRR